MTPFQEKMLAQKRMSGTVQLINICWMAYFLILAVILARPSMHPERVYYMSSVCFTVVAILRGRAVWKSASW